MDMAITGYYDGTSVITNHKFALNQKVILIPIENEVPDKEDKTYDIIEQLYGCLKDTGKSLEDYKEERLKKYEITD